MSEDRAPYPGSEVSRVVSYVMVSGSQAEGVVLRLVGHHVTARLVMTPKEARSLGGLLGIGSHVTRTFCESLSLQQPGQVIIAPVPPQGSPRPKLAQCPAPAGEGGQNG